ncbi:transposable element [Tanacetum coccineum]
MVGVLGSGGGGRIGVNDDRVITDNAIVAFEVFHWLKKKTDGRKGALTPKIDMSKAHDKVKWPFIRAVLNKFGFPSHFSNLIMACVSSVSFSYNINGQVSRYVTPTRGHIHGVKVCRGMSEISHLFFADDSVCFTRSLVEESCSCSSRPSAIERSKKVGFEAIIDKIKKKLGRWKEKTLSIARKEVLIKSVAQAMPMYIMNIFLLPSNLIDDIHKSLNVYWWGTGLKKAQSSGVSGKECGYQSFE